MIPIAHATNVGFAIALILIGVGGMLTMTAEPEPTNWTKLGFVVFFGLVVGGGLWLTHIIASDGALIIDGAPALLVMCLFGAGGVGLLALGLVGLLMKPSGGIQRRIER